MTIEIPDLDEMLKVSDEIADLEYDLAVKKITLENVLASITEDTTNNEGFWVGGKPPSNAHVKSTYYMLGRDEVEGTALTDLRVDIAKLEAEIKRKQNYLSIYHKKIEIWRTISANERISLV